MFKVQGSTIGSTIVCDYSGTFSNYTDASLNCPSYISARATFAFSSSTFYLQFLLKIFSFCFLSENQP